MYGKADVRIHTRVRAREANRRTFFRVDLNHMLFDGLAKSLYG